MARPDRLIGQAWTKASKSFQVELRAAGKMISQTAIEKFDAASSDFLRDVGAQNGKEGEIPYYTGNLMDSIGVRILQGSVMKTYRMIYDEPGYEIAAEPQHMGNLKNIWGYVEIFRRLNRPSRRIGQSVVAQMMVGVPYAQEVDWKREFMPYLKDKFVSRIERASKELETSRWRLN